MNYLVILLSGVLAGVLMMLFGLDVLAAIVGPAVALGVALVMERRK